MRACRSIGDTVLVPKHIVEFRIETNVDGGEVGSVLIVDGDDPDLIYEQIRQFMTRAEAQALAARRGLAYREV